MEEPSAIKKGLNVYLYYLTIPTFVIFIIINYMFSVERFSNLDLGIMISVVSFLFGFIITITFSMLQSKVSNLKEALATETGRLVSLFLLSKNLGSKFHETIKSCIDEYTICTLRYYTNYNYSREQMYKIIESINLMEIKTKNQETMANSFLYILGELGPVRERLEYLTSRRVEWSLKFSNYILGAILVILLFLNRGDLFSNALFVVLSTTVVFILLILEDYDNLKIGDYTVNISNSEQIFDLIGVERYYPESVLSRTHLESGKKYRIGIYDSKAKEERIFSITYNPSFNLAVSNLVKKFTRRIKKT